MKINPTGFLAGLSEKKFVKYLTNPASSSAVTIATVSNLTKDGVNCIYYVTQSLNNERIPEENRKFVAGIDLANGILNVILQAGVSAALATGIAKVFDKKIAPKHFNEAKYKELWKGLEKDIPYEEFFHHMEKIKGFSKTGFSVISTLVAMQVITKRILVPLIATPMADKFKVMFEKMEEGKKAKDAKEDIIEDKKDIKEIDDLDDIDDVEEIEKEENLQIAIA